MAFRLRPGGSEERQQRGRVAADLRKGEALPDEVARVGARRLERVGVGAQRLERGGVGAGQRGVGSQLHASWRDADALSTILDGVRGPRCWCA